MFKNGQDSKSNIQVIVAFEGLAWINSCEQLLGVDVVCSLTP